jgi:hypothetical protein
MGDRKTREFEIVVTRLYSVSETFNIISDSEIAAVEEAERRSGDTDYRSKLELVDVDVDIYSEEVIDD